MPLVRPLPKQRCVRWGPSSPSPKKGTEPPPIFRPCLLWPNDWMDQNATWCGGRPRSKRHCLRWETQLPLKRGTSPTFRPMSIVAKRSPISTTAEQLLRSLRQRVAILYNGLPLPLNIAPSYGDLDPHLIHGCSCPPEFSTQTPSRSVQLLQNSLLVTILRRVGRKTLSQSTKPSV